MTRRFCQSHPEATDPLASMSAASISRYVNPPSAWMTWLVGETARRTVFLAHIVNFFAAKDSPYYEPLGDDMIWNMPLPASTAAWSARSEHEWLAAMQIDNGVGHMMNPMDILSNSPTLKSLFAKFTKDHLHIAFGGNYGLSDSESLRALVVLCALEQLR